MRIGYCRGIALLACLGLLLSDAYAQETGSRLPGILRGTVKAESTSAAIEGVAVTVAGAGREWSARSDTAGAFALELPPGVYEITLSHEDFDERAFPQVEITAGKVSSAEVTMKRGVAGPSGGVEEIVVTGREMERTIDQTRFSDSVLDSLSSADFKATADSDVVGALARVTGVTVVDGKFVYVRGLGERYSSTLFNSALLPSPDPARRIVPLDLFPTNVMEELTIQKSWAPYLPGDFSGGSVQMTTRSVPQTYESTMGMAVEYNSETTGRDVLWNEGGDSDWSGFGDGFRGLPEVIKDLSVDGHLQDPSALTDEQLSAVGLSLDRTFETGTITAPPNVELNYSNGNRFDTHAGTLGYLFGLRYNNAWQFTREARRSSQIVFDGENFVPAVGDDFDETETVNAIDYSALATGEWSPTDEHVVRSTVFWSQLTDKRFIRDVGFENQNLRNIATTTWEWEQRQLVSAQLVGDHYFPDFAEIALDWGATYSQANRDKPDSRFYEYEDLDENGMYQFSSAPTGNTRQWEKLTDDAWDLLLNGERSFELHENLYTTIKLGGKYFDKNRNSSLRAFRYSPRFATGEFDEVSHQRPEGVFDDDNIGRGKWELQEVTQFTDSYTAQETISAGYLQADNEIFEKWRLMLGFRYEDSLQETKTRAATGGTPVVTKLDDAFVMPAASLTWLFRDDMQLRGAFSQTVNRPDLREISSAPYLDPEDRDVFIGNPDLQIAQINNYDLRWEWYHGGLNSVSLALFYKQFTDPIEETLLLRGSSVLRTYTNAESADLYGAEAQAQQSLEPLHDWARDLSVKVNGAVMTSEVEVNPDAINQTNDKRRLQGQSDWVVNSILTYDDLLRDLQVTLALNWFGDRIADVGVNGFEDAVEESGPRLDFVTRYGFELWGWPMAIRFRADNLLDPDYTRTRAGVTEREFHLGRYFQLKLEVEL